jgi:hypothetical protein
MDQPWRVFCCFCDLGTTRDTARYWNLFFGFAACLMICRLRCSNSIKCSIASVIAFRSGITVLSSDSAFQVSRRLTTPASAVVASIGRNAQRRVKLALM